MDVRDVRTIAVDAPIEADVCIVGSGPAGLTLATELSGSAHRVVVLESGTLERTDSADALNEVENVGAPRSPDQWGVRNRIFGGTSATWSGRLATLDDVDFATREWVPWSGWPMDRSEVEPYFARTLPYFGSAVADNNSAEMADLLDDAWPGLDPDLFRAYGYSYSHDAVDPGVAMRFGPRALGANLPGVVAYTDATVVRLDTDPAGKRVDEVVVRSSDGTQRTVRARVVVLCAGAIENARLLLASNRLVPSGVGNDHDNVGRFLMDHPRGQVGLFRPEDHFAVQRMFRELLGRRGTGVSLIRAAALTEKAQQEHELLNCALFVFTGEISDDDPLRALKAIARGRQPGLHLRRLIRNRDVVMDNIHDRVVLRRPSVVRGRTDITLQCMVEQRPDPNSRITLSRKVDANGSCLPVIDWRISDQEAATARFATTSFAAELQRLGLPVPVLSEMITDPSAGFYLPDVAHPIGTTRMSADPRAGVVNTDGAVHGMDSLYVAGSSVFPTAGHANPTQMIVALTLRLADHLKSTLHAG